MKFGDVYDYRNAEEAKKYIGKKGAFSDHFWDICEEPEGRLLGTLVKADGKNVYPFMRQDDEGFQFFRPILEEEKEERMTNRQLAEWLAKGNGEYSYDSGYTISYNFVYSKGQEAEPTPDYYILIRRWGDTEWVKPTRAIYEEDCK